MAVASLMVRDDLTHDAEHGAGAAPSQGFSLREFIHDEAFGGILLLACAVVALIWANSPWGDAYDQLWSTELALGTVQFHLTESLRHWVNDGLMAIFFFVVGLEIKREVLVGELASPRRAALPAVAALGGAILPAVIFILLNRGTPGAAGWGIPMATDIAFALGVLALLGDRVPLGLKVFLAALAIVDDILAVLVIAIFYTAQVHWEALGLAAVIVALLIAANWLGARRPVIYGILGLALWVAVFESGVHATVAGILLALTIPAKTRLDPDAFVATSRTLLNAFERAGEHGASILTNGPRQEALSELEEFGRGRRERRCNGWSTSSIPGPPSSSCHSSPWPTRGCGSRAISKRRWPTLSRSASSSGSSSASNWG